MNVTAPPIREMLSQERQELRAFAEDILTRARSPDGPWGDLSPPVRADLERKARQCVDFFQRSSSCVEGRNGQEANWTVHRTRFSHDVPILDFIRALCHVFAGALAGRRLREALTTFWRDHPSRATGQRCYHTASKGATKCTLHPNNPSKG